MAQMTARLLLKIGWTEDGKGGYLSPRNKRGNRVLFQPGADSPWRFIWYDGDSAPLSFLKTTQDFYHHMKALGIPFPPPPTED